MAIYTPRGLKIRISVPYAFGLMARLSPKVSPFRILKTTEGIDSVPSMLAFFAGLVAFAMRLSPIEIGLLVAGAHLFGNLLNMFGLFVIPGLVRLGTFYSNLAGYGVFLIVLLAVGFVMVGWQGLLAFLVGRLVSGLTSCVLECWRAGRYHKLGGYPFSPSEINFFNAYRLHASRVNVTTDIDLDDSELEEEHWGPTFEQFASEWPTVVRRFTIN